MPVMMLRGVVPALETHHNVRILDEAVSSAAANCLTVTLPTANSGQSGQCSGHGLRAACAESKLDPPAVEDVVRELEDLNVQIESLNARQPSERILKRGSNNWPPRRARPNNVWPK